MVLVTDADVLLAVEFKCVIYFHAVSNERVPRGGPAVGRLREGFYQVRSCGQFGMG
jgi:hypothetical protein